MSYKSYEDSSETFTIHCGNCLDVMRGMESDSVDSVVTDPPYGLSFMGKNWDHGVPGVPFWREALRVAKPGAMLLAFGGTRTFHRLVCAIEDAGWEIRDTVMWVYGSGFPKSLNVQQAINKAARGAPQGGPDPTSPNHGKFKGGCGEESREGRGFGAGPGSFMKEGGAARMGDDGPWHGWGTALKPAWEPIVVARKPLDGTVAENVLRWGTGGLNVDGCRVATDPTVDDPRLGGKGTWRTDKAAKNVYEGGYAGDDIASSTKGRWPANLILTYPEDEYMLRDDVTPDQLHKLAEWMNANR